MLIKSKRKTKSRKNNLETKSTLGTRQGQRKTKEKQIKNEQSRDSINIGHKTRTKKNKRKTKSRMNNPETKSTLSTRQEQRKTKSILSLDCSFLILFLFCFSSFLSCAQC
jgi:hypothetical protein